MIRLDKTKKAAFWDDAVPKIVIAAIVIIILVIIFRSMSDTADNVASRQACKQSVEMSGFKLQGITDRFGNPVKLQCSTEYLNYATKDDETIKKEIADKMVECWDTFGNGEKEIFDTKDGRYCVVCSRLTFDKKTDLPEFSNYLNNNIAPMKDTSYMQYLTGVRVNDYKASVYDNTGLQEFDTISTREPLAIMFVMDKDAYPGGMKDIEAQGTKLTTTVEGLAIGTAAGATLAIGTAVAGAALCSTGVGCLVVIGVAAVAGGGMGYAIGSDRTADWDARIVVWPYEKLDTLECTYLESKSAPLTIKEIKATNEDSNTGIIEITGGDG